VRRACRALAGALAVLAAPAEAQQAGHGGSALRPYADPAAVVAADIAFNQLARVRGQWTAFRETAAIGAVMVMPRKVDARDWLKRQPDPPVAARWQPHEVWLSCDGSYAVTRSGWRKPDSTGAFVTVWQRQAKDRRYKWVLATGETLATPLDAPEMIAGRIAECAGRPARSAPPATPAVVDNASGQSDDGTLRWTTVLDERGAGSVSVQRWTGSAYVEVLQVAIEGG
jgi:hypothetical protein